MILIHEGGRWVSLGGPSPRPASVIPNVFSTAGRMAKGRRRIRGIGNTWDIQCGPGVARGRRGSIEIFLVRGIATRLISLPGPFRERDTNFLSLERRVYRWRAWRGMPRVRAPIGAREASISGGKRPRGASLPTRTQFTGPQSELIAVKKNARSAVSWISRRC